MGRTIKKAKTEISEEVDTLVTIPKVVVEKTETTEKKDKKEKKEKKDKKEKKEKKESTTTETTETSTPTTPVVEAVDTSILDLLQKKKRPGQKDPFTVLDSEPFGVTYKLKSEIRERTHKMALAIVKKEITNVTIDHSFKDLDNEIFNYPTDLSSHTIRTKFETWYNSQKINELNRHFQVWALNPINLSNDCSDITETGEELKLIIAKGKKVFESYCAFRKRRAKDFKDRADRSTYAKKILSGEIVDTKKTKVEATVAPVDDVATRIKLAQEAALARQKLAQYADDE